MKFMFGYDEVNTEQCFESLAEKGYSAVVAPSFSERAVRAAEEYELMRYCCFGAFSVPENDISHYAVTAEGESVRWFGSGCPCNRENAMYNLQTAIDRAIDCGADGLFVDGARFASPASEEGFGSLFTCFCGRCVKYAGHHGMSMEEMRYAATTLKQVLQGRLGMTQLKQAANGLKCILAFRELVIKEYMELFVHQVKQRMPEAYTGAFVFPHSLGWLVGQTEEAYAPLDIVSPMVYRRYRTAPGTATLNYEWSALQRAVTEHTGLPLRAAAARWEEYTGVSLRHTKPEDIMEHGFLPEDCVDEAALINHPFVAPIIQLDDDKASYLAALMYRTGKIKSFGCFAYGSNAD